MKKHIPKTLQSTARLWIILGIDCIFSTLLYVVLAVIGISEIIRLLIAFLTLLGGTLVTASIIHHRSSHLKQSRGKTPSVASRREFFRSLPVIALSKVADPIGQEMLHAPDVILSGRANDLTKAKKWEEAEHVARSIKEEFISAFALNGLAGALIDAKEWQEAERIARLIEQERWRADALRDLAFALTQAQKWEEAERVADSIERKDERARALRDLATALRQAQKWEEAERAARSIEQKDERARALQYLAFALTDAKEWQEVERVARSIEQEWDRAWALQNLATAFAQAKEWEEAERVARSIDLDEERARALEDLAGALTQAGEREHAQTLRQEAQDIRSSPPSKKKPSSPPPSWDEIIHTFMSSPEGEITTLISMIASITGVTAITVIKWLWSKKHGSQEEPPSQSLETDFDRIRLRMAYGPDQFFAEWLDDPDKLKDYIQACNQPSSRNPAITVYFRQRNGTEFPVDARNYLQLDELLSYLKSQNERKKPKTAEDET